MRKRFLYYLPKMSGCNERMLADRGLRTRFVNQGGDGLIEHGITATIEGPEGNGVLVGIGGQPAEYAPDRQEWQQGNGFWVGMEKTFRPGAQDLVREWNIVGYQIRLADGAEWIVPLLRRWNRERCEHVSALPKCIRPVNGRMREVVVPRYEAHDAIAENIWQSFMQEKSFTLDEIFANCANLLAVNYRVGPEEIALLGLLEKETALAAMGLAIDLPSFREHAAEIAFDGLEVSTPAIEEVEP